MKDVDREHRPVGRVELALWRLPALADDEVDEINANMFTILQALMMARPDTVERAVSTLSASRHLERIADLATNIAEDVIFMQRGVVVRHQFRAYITH